MKKNSKILLLLVSVLTLLFIAACGTDNTDTSTDTDTDTDAGQETNDGTDEPEEREEITIRWAHQWGQDHFDEGIGKDLGEVFPHITIEVQEAGTDHPTTLQEVIAAGEYPDIVTLGLATHVPFLENLGLAYNHNDLIEETGFDLDRLEPTIVEYARNQDPTGDREGLYVIPNSRPTWSLHYNKNVFDQFGVDYPHDGITWEETVELAKEVTGEMNGIQYRGLDLDVPYDEFTQFSTTLVDPDTDEPNVMDNEYFRRFLEMVEEVINIPGNYPEEDPTSLLHNWGSLFGEENIAMAPAATHFGWLGMDSVDIVTFPVWEGFEGLQPVANAGAYAITEPSEHKEEVMEIIEYLLSDEYQIEVSKSGTPSILVSEEVNSVLGQDKEEFEGKNLDSLFLHEYATGAERTSDYGIPGLWTAPADYINSGQDINEFLRQYHEQGAEYIRETKAAE